MPKLMKPLTFGCENGFQEVFYEMEDPIEHTKQVPGQIYCYLNRLDDKDKVNKENLKKCVSMKPGQCWKKH